jgi:hypothetical protein
MALAAWNINRTDYGLGLVVDGADDTLSQTLHGDLKRREDEDLPARLAILESFDDGPWRRHDFTQASSFEAALSKGSFSRSSPNPSPTRITAEDAPAKVNRIYVLESALLRTTFARLVQSHLCAPAALFAEQQRSTTPVVGSDCLASILSTRDVQSLMYPHLVAMPASVRECFWLRCAATGREVASTRILGEFH